MLVSSLRQHSAGLQCVPPIVIDIDPVLHSFVANNPDNHITWRRYIERTMIDEHNLSTSAIFSGAA